MKTPNDLITALESALAIAKGLAPTPTLPKPLPDGYELVVPKNGDDISKFLALLKDGHSSEEWVLSDSAVMVDAAVANDTYLFARRIWTLPPPFVIPPLPEGMEYHRVDGWSKEMLPEGYRPLLKGERMQKDTDSFRFPNESEWTTVYGLDGYFAEQGKFVRTTRPLPEPPAPPKAWWSKPEHVPTPCWIGQPSEDEGDYCGSMVISVSPKGIVTLNEDNELQECFWSELESWGSIYSTTRTPGSWKLCVVESTK